jgi:hypothetical protein
MGKKGVEAGALSLHKCAASASFQGGGLLLGQGAMAMHWTRHHLQPRNA